MRPLDNPELSPPPSTEFQELDFSLRQALQILRWLGYGLLIFTLIDWIYTLTPLKAMNPIWEFQTIGLLVDKVIIPLFGLSLVFAGAELERGQWELRFLKLLSWLTLLIGIFYLLLVPLGVLNTVRIDQLNQRQINRTEESQLKAIRSVESRIPAITNEAELNEVIYLLNQGGLQVSPTPGQSLNSIKEDLATFIRGAREKLGAQLQDALKQQRFDLLRNSVKWNLGAFIAAVWFIGLWRLSEWTRM